MYEVPVATYGESTLQALHIASFGGCISLSEMLVGLGEVVTLRHTAYCLLFTANFSLQTA